MGTNTYAPNGLTPGGARSRIGSAANYAMSQFFIKQSYGTNIGRGDLVNFGTGTSQGYIIVSALADLNGVGVFNSVYPYYDQTAQQTMHGLNGSYASSANPNAPIQCAVVADPFATFIAQVNGSTGWLQSWQGQNINWVTGTNGAPDITGQSTLALDFNSISTDPNLPLRIVGPAGVSGGPQDPANVNPWIEVALNGTWLLNRQGI